MAKGKLHLGKFPLRCGIVSIGKICRLFRHLYQNYHCQWSPLVAKWWKVTIPHRTRNSFPMIPALPKLSGQLLHTSECLFWFECQSWGYCQHVQTIYGKFQFLTLECEWDQVREWVCLDVLGRPSIEFFPQHHI